MGIMCVTVRSTKECWSTGDVFKKFSGVPTLSETDKRWVSFLLRGLSTDGISKTDSPCVMMQCGRLLVAVVGSKTDSQSVMMIAMHGKEYVALPSFRDIRLVRPKNPDPPGLQVVH